MNKQVKFSLMLVLLCGSAQTSADELFTEINYSIAKSISIFSEQYKDDFNRNLITRIANSLAFEVHLLNHINVEVANNKAQKEVRMQSVKKEVSHEQ